MSIFNEDFGSLFNAGCELRLLVIGISVAICVMPTCKVQKCWPPARRGLILPTARREYWSNGVLGLKAEIDLIYTLLPLVTRDPNKVYIFPLYQPFINPLLHHSNTPGTINHLL
jgi:hypothetical protein